MWNPSTKGCWGLGHGLQSLWGQDQCVQSLMGQLGAGLAKEVSRRHPASHSQFHIPSSQPTIDYPGG